MRTHRNTKSLPVADGKVRYAVVGLGHIAQGAVLPAFAHAAANSRLVALVSDDPVKQQKLGNRYDAPQTYFYRDYEICLRSGEIDAVYIAVPNARHREFAVRAAEAGVHVLCEKPLGITEEECEEMTRICADNDVKLMTAYRLHFAKSNLEAIRVLQSGEIGEPRIFNSLFAMQVKEGNVRLKQELGGGTLYDIGIYCINAARYLFRAEPTEVFAFSANNGEKRFREVDEMTSAVLRFPDQRLATFTSSFGAADISTCEIVGTKGVLRLNRAYEYAATTEMTVTVGEKTRKRTFPRQDQFAAELLYFSECILDDKPPEPSGVEGLIDVHVIRSLYESAKTGQPIKLRELTRQRRPTSRLEINRPPVGKTLKVHVEAPSRS